MNLSMLPEIVAAGKDSLAFVAPVVFVFFILVDLVGVVEFLAADAARAMPIFLVIAEVVARAVVRLVVALEADVVCSGCFAMLLVRLRGVEYEGAMPAQRMLP